MDLSGIPPTIAVTLAERVCRAKWGRQESSTVAYGHKELELLLSLRFDLRQIRASSSAIDLATSFFALESLTLVGPVMALHKLNRCKYLREVVLLNCSALTRRDYTSFFLSTASQSFLSRLTHLDLRHCRELPVALLKLPQLKTLSLSGAVLTATEVQGWKVAMPRLSRLCISETKISTETRETLEALGQDPGGGVHVEYMRVAEFNKGLIKRKHQ